MALYRKKPVVIEAIQLRWDTWEQICDFVKVGKLSDGEPEGCYVDPDGKVREGHENEDRIGLQVPTLEGVMIACQDDWIIKGVNGEFYPCKPDIFAKTYELVDFRGLPQKV